MKFFIYLFLVFISSTSCDQNQGRYTEPSNEHNTEILAKIFKEIIKKEINENLKNQISNLEIKISENKKDISENINTNLDNLKTEIGSLNTKLDNLKTEIGSLNTNLDNLKTEIASSNTKIDNIETKEIKEIIEKVKNNKLTITKGDQEKLYQIFDNLDQEGVEKQIKNLKELGLDINLNEVFKYDTNVDDEDKEDKIAGIQLAIDIALSNLGKKP